MSNGDKPKNFLILTAHDYRTPRRASIHLTAEQLAKRGKLRFFSLRYSLLSTFRPDARNGADIIPNKIENYQGADCYLWKTVLHPFNFRLALFEPLEPYLYRLYVWFAPSVLKQWICEADTVFIESGTPLVFYALIKKLNPSAHIIYLCSDPLSVINSSKFVRNLLARFSSDFDICIVRSRLMVEGFEQGSKISYVPPGFDVPLDNERLVSPYGVGLHAVSVGSMLFDSSFFEHAGRLFPDITFHVIGCGVERPANWPANVRIYGEMKYNDTLRFIKFATIGLAPYAADSIPRSLADTSLKMLQYAYYGVPTVCPAEVTGEHRNRFGYQSGDAASISIAIKMAISAGRSDGTKPLNWEQVTDRVLNPAAYADTLWEPPKSDFQQAVRDQKPLISLVVSTLGRSTTLINLFQSLARQEYKNFEVIVVDQNEDDRLLSIVDQKRWPFALIYVSASGQKGLSRGRNLGLSRVSGDIVAFPDDDCWYPSDFLKKGIELLAQRDCGSVSGRAVEEITLRSINGTFENGPAWVDRNNVWKTQIEWVVLFKRSVLEAIHGYDENIGIGSATPWQACEGQDITLRLLEAGYRSYYDPLLFGFHAEHNISVPTEDLIAKGRCYSRGLGHVLRRHHYGFASVAYWIVRPLIGTVVYFAKGNIPRSRYSLNMLMGRLEGWLNFVFRA